MPQIPNKIIKERAKILRLEGNKIIQRFLKKQINKKHKVLFESEIEGHSENFIPIITKTKHKIGSIVLVIGKYVNDGKLVSQAI